MGCKNQKLVTLTELPCEIFMQSIFEADEDRENADEMKHHKQHFCSTLVEFHIKCIKLNIVLIYTIIYIMTIEDISS